MQRRTVQWRQLCAIADAAIQMDPTIDDGEWVEEIKRRIVRLRFEYPSPEQLTNAIRAVERMLAKEWGPRS
jgi:hypothetical protein